ncbi:putative peptidyl-prolyl cis-trans isomerase [Sphingomonas changbaiensis NBRC 104936]|uniref:Peptidyl-prolyl cis-trans isomerase n=1 Tax=Sphingomonas changbaiensis NBRC 104936 TaxID=1219043 RepID=A0A0E9MTA4_9SPHN|nr:peptidylprolyl isomerase [Sphingomonas changbaiensis]GAO40708.1 putative peptidyl-prolyl cis-trans isomerase [Sphingomonas changbaiensis NBRC 104936]
MRLIAAILALLGALFATAAIAKKAPKPNPAPSPAAAEALVTPPVTPENTWVLELSTGGRVLIQLRPDKAPNTVERIKTLTRSGFYNGLTFHRVIEGFMAQGGDPKGTGEGGSPLPDLKAEFNDLPHVRGVVSMARADAVDSANSQFFIMLMPTLRLDNHYTPFGRVISGMQYVDAIEKGEPPANPSRIIKAWIQSDGENAPPVPLPAVAATPAPAATAAPAPTTPEPAPAPSPTPTPQPSH